VDRFELSTSWSQIRLLPSREVPPGPVSYLGVASQYHLKLSRAILASRVG